MYSLVANAYFFILVKLIQYRQLSPPYIQKLSTISSYQTVFRNVVYIFTKQTRKKY